jgi:hypothetical protein
MLMSTAIAHWKVKDAKKEIFGLVDQVRAKGFFIDKDFILKACLYLYSGDIRYKISNFSQAQVKRFNRCPRLLRDATQAAPSRADKTIE